MAVFYSFHFERDAWRVQEIIQMGAIEGQPLLSSQAWEEIKRKGDRAVEKWIDEQMKYKTAVVVLVGTKTASRRWCTMRSRRRGTRGAGWSAFGYTGSQIETAAPT